MEAESEEPYPSADEIRAVRLPEGYVLDGRYRIVRRIGEGGAGAVFEAEQIAVGRRVAVKVLHPAFVAVGEVVARFRREALALGRLAGPHVVAVIDVGEASTPEGALPYIVMELLAGESLAERMRREPITVGESVRIIRGLLDALTTVHAHGMLHRDLKPENVFLSRGGPLGEAVKLVDFGLSRPESADAARLTRAGLTLGTPMYMAPEQISGAAIDHRADLFAVGVTLYELVTGRVPFEGPNHTAVLTRVLTAAPLPPRAIVPSLPQGLEAAILKSLEKDPAARFATASEFQAALVPFGLQPPHARAGAITQKIVVPKRRRRWALHLFAVATLLASAPSATEDLSRSPESDAPRRAAAARPASPPAPGRNRPAPLPDHPPIRVRSVVRGVPPAPPRGGSAPTLRW
jgi:serine/threonine-protein kinase